MIGIKLSEPSDLARSTHLLSERGPPVVPPFAHAVSLRRLSERFEKQTLNIVRHVAPIVFINRWRTRQVERGHFVAR